MLKTTEIKEASVVIPDNDDIKQTLDTPKPTTTCTDTNQADLESLLEVSIESSMASIDLYPPKKKEKKKKKTAKGSNESGVPKNKEVASAPTSGDTNLNCLHCNVRFYIKNDFLAHCRTEKHQQTVMSDEGM